MIEERKKFWDSQHSSDDIPTLSGCEYDETIDFMKIRELIKSDINVLEIGVGMGYVTKGFFDSGCNVSALDISDVALERVKPITKNVYNTSELEKIPSDHFDLILCRNVVQHVATHYLRMELEHVIRSLKKDGILAIQFVSATEVEDNGLAAIYNTYELGEYCRSKKYFENLINNLGGSCELVLDIPCDFTFSKVTGNHVFHVRKNLEQ